MSSENKNLSSYNELTLELPQSFKIGLLVAEWNEEITFALRDGAIKTLTDYGVEENNSNRQLILAYVPGAFELPSGAQMLFETCNVDAVITLGCVIRGGTPHFDYVCQGTTQGVLQVGLMAKKPCVFGVLTTDDMEQAQDRAGGKHGNKGDEAAITALKMLALQHHLKNNIK